MDAWNCADVLLGNEPVWGRAPASVVVDGGGRVVVVRGRGGVVDGGVVDGGVVDGGVVAAAGAVGWELAGRSAQIIRTASAMVTTASGTKRRTSRSLRFRLDRVPAMSPPGYARARPTCLPTGALDHPRISRLPPGRAGGLDKVV
jgi:hypothetical protein